jgi:hypothetical protein
VVHVLPEGASPQDADRDGLVCDDWPHCGLLGGVSRQVEYQGMQAMTETPKDWADEKAREWCRRWQQDLSKYSYALSHNDWLEISAEEVESLAALLREPRP